MPPGSSGRPAEPPPQESQRSQQRKFHFSVPAGVGPGDVITLYSPRGSTVPITIPSDAKEGKLYSITLPSNADSPKKKATQTRVEVPEGVKPGEVARRAITHTLTARARAPTLVGVSVHSALSSHTASAPRAVCGSVVQVIRGKTAEGRPFEAVVPSHAKPGDSFMIACPLMDEEHAHKQEQGEGASSMADSKHEAGADGEDFLGAVTRRFSALGGSALESTFRMFGAAAALVSAFGGDAIDKSDEGLRRAFAEADTDNSGKISSEEMEAYIVKVYGEGIDEKVVVDMMLEADLDGDGEVDFDEFKKIMRAGPEDKESKQD